MGTTERLPTFCPLCVSRCGASAVIQDGVFTALEPDPSHPTGQALCPKGRAAPELVASRARLPHPLRRTRPKGDADPGWREISWDEALSETAARLQDLAHEHGPESVAFAASSPSTSALSDSIDWIDRLRNAYGSPNMLVAMELCGFGRYFATSFTFGAPVPGAYLPDLDHAGCILFWGYNPAVSRLSHAASASAAQRRGAKLIVVDPRRAGLANRADVWLRVRPGTDTALALSIAGVMIERGWFDRDFLARWTDAPFLVRDDGRLLRGADLLPGGDPGAYVAWSERLGGLAVLDPGSAPSQGELALSGARTVAGVPCRTVFDRLTELCRRYDPRTAAGLCGVAAGEIEAAARLLWEARPLAYYAWSGIEQHTGATQMARAVAQLCVLTGSLDVEGGNVLFPSVPTAAVSGAELLHATRRARALGLAERPLSAARAGFVTSDDFYTAALEGRPYRTHGLVGFGSNILLAHANSARGRKALAALQFQVHADLFMNPTAEMADIVLPVTSPFEAEGLRVGFEISEAAQSLVQLRRPAAAPRGAARSDVQIVFALATRLGLGEHFWNGDVDSGYRHQLAPSGLSLEELRAHPEGLRVTLRTRHRKYAEIVDGRPRGFATPSRRIELYSETLQRHGYPALPAHEEPAMSPRGRPELAARFPLVLTSAKPLWFCETQHRSLPSLRRRAPDPEVEIHPDAAAARGIAAGDWVRILTPSGSVRARARLNRDLDPGVVVGQHGWWQACEEIGAPSFDPFSAEGANLNLLVDDRPRDPISGSAPHRSYLCEIARA